MDEAKTIAMLAAARVHFFTHGYEGTRLDAVASDAGVSKVTIYNRFGDKAGLLAACVGAECERMQAEIGLDRDDGRSLTERLNAFGTTLVTFLQSPEHVGFDRMISMEGVRSPELARLFFDAGPKRMQAALVAVLAQATTTGEVEADDPREAAEHLVGLWKGMADMHLRFAQPYDRDPERVAARVRRSTDRFLRAYAPTGTSGALNILVEGTPNPKETPMSKPDNLEDLYYGELKDLWSANDQMHRTLKKVTGKISNDKLKKMLDKSLDGIEKHTETVKSLIESGGEKVKKEHCKGMEGLVSEFTKHTTEEAPTDPDAFDAVVISQYQRMSHYGIAGFGTAAAYAEALGLSDDRKKLDAITKDIYGADEYGTKLAETAVNLKAKED